MWVSYSTHLIDAFDTWNAVGWLLLTLMLYGVWRLWRGMRPDAFERGLRALREDGQTTVAFPRSRSRQILESRQTGQALQRRAVLTQRLAADFAAAADADQLRGGDAAGPGSRPDDVSRPATWALFIVVGTWYGARAWPHWRGVGPLRNHALAGVFSGVGVSVLLWGFYLAVDLSWGQTSFTRVNASLPTLLWWTAVGGAIGAASGAVRASRIYGATRAQPRSDEAPSAAAPLAVQASPRRRRVQWGAIAMACAASLLFHLSATPHLYRKVDIRYWTWNWHWHPHHHSGPSMTLTMAPARALPARERTFLVGYAHDAQERAQVVQETEGIDEWTGAGTTNVPQGYPFLTPQANSSGVMQAVALPARTINPGERITREMLSFEPYPLTNVDVVRDPQTIVGHYAVARLVPSRPIALGQTTPSSRAARLAAPQDPLVVTETIEEIGEQRDAGLWATPVAVATGEATEVNSVADQGLGATGAAPADVSELVDLRANPEAFAPRPLDPAVILRAISGAASQSKPAPAPSDLDEQRPLADGFIGRESPFEGDSPGGVGEPRLGTAIGGATGGVILNRPGDEQQKLGQGETQPMTDDLVGPVVVFLEDGRRLTGKIVKSELQLVRLRLTGGQVVTVDRDQIATLKNLKELPQPPADIATPLSPMDEDGDAAAEMDADVTDGVPEAADEGAARIDVERKPARDFGAAPVSNQVFTSYIGFRR